MPDDKNLNDTQVKLYTLLVDQLQKYNTILWQFPTALLAANAFAIDKFQAQPWMVLALATADGVLIFAFRRLVIQQRVIIDATRKAEAFFCETDYQAFFPDFKISKSKWRVRSPSLIVWTLWALTAALVVFSLIKICGHTGQAP